MTPLSHDRIAEQLGEIRAEMKHGFSYLGQRIDSVARKVGVDEAELHTLKSEVAPLVVGSKWARRFVGVALLACASVAGGGLAVYALQRLGLGHPSVELSPPEIARP